MGNKDKKPTLKDLADAAQKQGFKLEFETYAVLNEYFKRNANFKIGESGVNFPVNSPPSNMGGIQQSTICREVDVYGSCSNHQKELAYHFLIECKGTSPDNKLLLVEETNSLYSNANNYFSEILLPDLSSGEKLLTPGKRSITPLKGQGPLQVFTGDFFKWNNKKFTQAGKTEDANNLYKGIRQLNIATEALMTNRQLIDSKCQNILVPMVVTNAEICIVDYEANEIFTAPWAFYRNRNQENETHIGYMPYVIITSLANLMDCLNSSSYEYKNWEKTPINLK